MYCCRPSIRVHRVTRAADFRYARGRFSGPGRHFAFVPEPDVATYRYRRRMSRRAETGPPYQLLASTSACSSQNRMSISRYRVVACPEVLLRLPARACAPVQLAEAVVAVSDQWTHSEFLGECERVTEVALGVLRPHHGGR